MRRAELIAACIAAIGGAFKLLHWPFASLLLILGLSTLAFLYFPLGYFLFGAPKRRDQMIVVTLLAGGVLSIAVLGVLFKVQWWPFSGLYLFVGIAGCVLIVLLSFVLRKSGDPLHRYYTNLLIRASVVGLLAVSLYGLPGHRWRTHRYPEHPRLVEMLDSLDNTSLSEGIRSDLQRRVSDEELRLDSLVHYHGRETTSTAP